MKRCIADGSVGFPHVRVGHRQASKSKTPNRFVWGFFFAANVRVSDRGGDGLLLAFVKDARVSSQSFYYPLYGLTATRGETRGKVIGITGP